MNYTIQAKSSGEEPYLVEFVLDGNQLTVSCNCQAGIFGKLCKHKTELLAGDKSRLFDESEESTLRQIYAIAQRAPEIVQLSNQIAECEQIVKSEQAKLKKAKKNLEAALSHGVEINTS
jgi:uncharacterized Zn finger protein